MDYEERNASNDESSVVESEYATKDQINEMNEHLNALNEKLNSFGEYVTKDQLKELNNHIAELGG